ncbi:hypothetical protein PAMC26577_23685 [Caballeronia sordidicola]|uniref:Uncharacterized protein n=1 Tax=Caballeronia sordidicola TaxID=196367 RepID=A0A242MJH6_CABSO|nr:hypothetical protein PAMC26577_23685 [Caballeronia sordidicola]
MDAQNGLRIKVAHGFMDSAESGRRSSTCQQPFRQPGTIATTTPERRNESNAAGWSCALTRNSGGMLKPGV